MLNNTLGYLEFDTEGVWSGLQPEDMRALKQSANEKERYSFGLSFEFHNSSTGSVASSTCTLSFSSQTHTCILADCSPTRFIFGTSFKACLQHFFKIN